MKGWVIGATGAVVLAGAGAATWAAVSFLGAGAVADQAFPADTIAFASVDLDPSGSQKIAAVKLIKKFPALKDQIDLGTTDDIRRAIVNALAKEADCTIDYDKDFEPWIGSAFGIGAVGVKKPELAVAVEVTDEAKAEKSVKKLLACDDTSDTGGYDIANGWLLIADDNATATKILKAAKDKPLADDSDYQRWTDEVGDKGFITGYVAPSAGTALAENIDDLMGLSDLASGAESDLTSAGAAWCPGMGSGNTDALKAAAKRFHGAGATLRFADDGLDLQVASDFGVAAKGARSADVADLPDKVGAVFAMGFTDGWFDSLIDQLKETCGDQFDPEPFYESISSFTGLDVPADIETLLSRSLQLAVGPDLNIETLINSLDPTSLPVALRVKGDPAKLEAIVKKLATLAPGTDFLTPKSSKDAVTIGLSPEWRDKVAGGGTLGKDPTFLSVVSEPDKVNSVLYIDLAVLRKAISTASGDDPEVDDNMAPLRALGISGWVDGKILHSKIAISVK